MQYEIHRAGTASPATADAPLVLPIGMDCARRVGLEWTTARESQRREIPSLTVRREVATIYPVERANEVLSQARADFPEYALELETVEGGVIVKTSPSMKVARWLRV